MKRINNRFEESKRHRLYFYTIEEGKPLLEMSRYSKRIPLFRIEILCCVAQDAHLFLHDIKDKLCPRRLDRPKSRLVCPFIGLYKISRCGVHGTPTTL